MKRTLPTYINVVSLLLLHFTVAVSQPEQNLGPLFESAAREFDVPAAVLEGIAFIETRWAHIRPQAKLDHERHMPPAYGVMGLRDDEWFGHSLRDAARLTNATPDVLKDDVGSNIRGAAALLASIASAQPQRPSIDDLQGWLDVIARYSGIPQRDIQGKYVQSLYQILHDGYDDWGIVIQPREIDMQEVEARISEIYSRVLSPLSEDYGPAVWYPSPNFNSRSGTPITHVIIHDTEGSFADALSWLTNPASGVSAHYLFRSSDGYLAQMVREGDRAWHVNCWNSWTVGIEHEGYVNQPQYYTPIMYEQSALLVRHLCDRYNISMDRLRIVGHFVWQDPVIFPQLGWDACNTHTDPGPFWNWDYFTSLIVADSTPPIVFSHVPSAGAQNVPVYKKISVKFDRPMSILATQDAFSLFPGISGSFSWSNDGTTMTFSPSAHLANLESYLVNITTAAKGSGGGQLQQALQFVFTTGPPDTEGPRITRSFPADSAVGVSPNMGFKIWFDESVVFSSFATRVRLVYLADTSVALGLGSVVYTDINDRGLLKFLPTSPLELDHTYRLSFLPGLRDVLGNLSSDEQRILFTVQVTPFVQGSVIDPFETNSAQWQQPHASPTTTGIDTTVTAFSISSTYKKGGSYSGKLAYTFTDTMGGLCRVLTLSRPPIQSANGWLGVWVFGDYSGNELEFWLSAVGGGDVIAQLGPINWFGWRFVHAPLGGNITDLNSIVLRQVSGASGAVYFDDMQVETITSVLAEGNGRVHSPFTLHQNYPNPFNPSTSIFFELERSEHVTLSVHNTLGQRVAVLLEKPMESGRYRVEFSGRSDDGLQLPSGVYFNRLQTSAGAQVRKMLLVK